MEAPNNTARSNALDVNNEKFTPHESFTALNNAENLPPERSYEILTLPPDFPDRFANKLVLINDGQLTRLDAIGKIVGFIKRHIKTPQMYQEFFKAMYIVQHAHTDTNMPHLLWSSLLWDHENDKKYLYTLVEWFIRANGTDLKFLDFQFEDEQTNKSRRTLSDAVIALCDNFLIVMQDAEEKSPDVALKLFSLIFYREAAAYEFIKRQKTDDIFFEEQITPVQQGENTNIFMFNEIMKYVGMAANGYYKNRHSILQQQNAKRLFEALQNHKQNLIQGLLMEMRQAKKAEDLKLYKNRNANKSEIDNAYALFKTNLSYFRDELRFNPHYIMAEYLRVFLFLFCMTLGFLGGLLGILGAYDATPTQGVIVIVLMIGYTMLVHTKKFYRSILPEDKYYLMQQSMPLLCSSMERFSLLQLTNFIHKHLNDAENTNTFIYIPNFLHFITTIYRSDTFMFITAEDLKEFLYDLNEKTTKIRWNFLNRG